MWTIWLTIEYIATIFANKMHGLRCLSKAITLESAKKKINPAHNANLLQTIDDERNPYVSISRHF